MKDLPRIRIFREFSLKIFLAMRNLRNLNLESEDFSIQTLFIFFSSIPALKFLAYRIDKTTKNAINALIQLFSSREGAKKRFRITLLFKARTQNDPPFIHVTKPLP